MRGDKKVMAEEKATNTYMTFLMHSTDGKAYTKLADIISYPDMGGSPNTIDTTTLSNRMMTSILGLQSSDALEFPTLYTPTLYAQLKGLENKTEKYALYLGGNDTGTGDPTPTGELGTFKFDGMLSARLTGGGVNEARKITITLVATSPIAFAQNAA